MSDKTLANWVYKARHGTHGASGLVCGQESGPVASIETGTVVARDRRGTRQARGLDPWRRVVERWVHSCRSEAVALGADAGGARRDFSWHGGSSLSGRSPPSSVARRRPSAVKSTAMVVPRRIAPLRRTRRQGSARDSLTRIIHERFCCNRRSAATTSLRPAGSPLGPSTYCTSTRRGLGAPRAGLATRLSDFATNCHE